MRAAVIVQYGGVKQCVAAAPIRTKQLAFDVRLSVDPFGAATSVEVQGGNTPLAACVQRALDGLRVTRPTPRNTRVSFVLALANVDRVTPQKPSPTPRARERTPTGRPGCMLARKVLPVDELALDDVTLDFAEPPFRTPHCPFRTTDKASIRAAVLGNLGGLRDCYIDAAKRIPDLAGRLDTQFVVDAWANLTQIAVSGAGDAAFHACISTELASIIVAARPERPIAVTLPFELDASASDPRSPDALATLAAASVKTATTALQECRARLALVEAFATLATGPDARTYAAIDGLVRFLHGPGKPARATCLDDSALTLLGRIATWPIQRPSFDLMHFRRGLGLAEALARTRRLIVLFPELAQPQLPFVAEAQLALLQIDEALATATAFLRLPNRSPADAKRVADVQARATKLQGALPFDDCELFAPY